MVGWVIGALWLEVYGLRFMVDGLGVSVRGLGFRGDFEGSLVSVLGERNTLVGREYTRERIHSGRNTLVGSRSLSHNTTWEISVQHDRWDLLISTVTHIKPN